jgi:osmotically-inducible protein OsmY
MKAFLGSVVCAVAMTGFSAASVGAAAPQAAASDKVLDSRIEQRIHKDPSLKKYDIDVAVDAGVATLTGTVATEADRAKAKQLATVKGIARVDNKIIVDLAAAQRTTGTAGTIKEKTKEGVEKTKEGAEKVADKTKEGASKVVDKTKEGLSKTGEVITDGWITTRVKSKFVGEDLLKGSDINVDTNDHVVTLKGTVTSAAARARAVEQAKEVEGVHKVVDLLTIAPKKP